jgi:hypothetical protein
VVSAAALTCFLAMPVHATEVNTARKSQYLGFDYQAFIAAKSQKVFLYGGVSKALPWLESFYETSEHADTAKQLLPLISGIKQLFADKQYSLVNDILLEMKLHKLSSAAKVAFISAAYPARNKLDNWSLSVDKVKSSLKLDGLDPENIFLGLI